MSETLKNLAKAFIGESQARNRYTFYAKVAKKEGYEKVAEVFLITAENEKEHAKRLFEHLQELKGDSEEVMVEVSAPVKYGTTVENLKAAIEGEDYEFTSMYPEFAAKAKEEGYDKVSERLLAIAKAEEHHRDRYKAILKELEQGTFFKKEEKVAWVCRECGYVHHGTAPPEKCPSCDHPSSYYELKCEKF